jgi:hypothetical protein
MFDQEVRQEHPYNSEQAHNSVVTLLMAFQPQAM